MKREVTLIGGYYHGQTRTVDQFDSIIKLPHSVYTSEPLTECEKLERYSPKINVNVEWDYYLRRVIAGHGDKPIVMFALASMTAVEALRAYQNLQQITKPPTEETANAPN